MTKPIIALGLLAAICAPLTALAADAQEDYADRYGYASWGDMVAASESPDRGTYVEECSASMCWMVDDTDESDDARLIEVPRGVAQHLDPLYFAPGMAGAL